MTQRKQKIFRPNTKPSSQYRNHRANRQRQRQTQLKNMALIDRPQQNFFKHLFSRNNYLWIIIHQPNILFSLQQTTIYNKVKDIYTKFQLKEQSMPICNKKAQYIYWLNQYSCNVVLDQSAINFYDQILSHQNCITVEAVIRNSKDAIVKLRNSKFMYKIRGIYDNWEVILTKMKQDMQKLKIVKQSEDIFIDKQRLPNFMRLRVQDKADLISYRNHLYFLMNLHNDKSDMSTSKNLFIEQSSKMYTSQKDRQFMNYYLTYPFSHKEILKFYTEDSFFFKCLNNTLRVAKSTQEFFIIGHPFNKLFHAIKNIYQQQNAVGLLKQKQLMFYRGADLAQSQVQFLQSCIGSFIEMYGFISTTINEEVARKFAKNRKHNKIIQIIIDQGYGSDMLDDNDYGFVDISSLSRFQQQKEYLFNALNIFKVLGKQKRGDYQYFTLIYGNIFNILKSKNPLQLQQKDRMAYYTYKQLIGKKDEDNNDLGQIFLKCHQTQKSVDYYEIKIQEYINQKKSQQQITQLKIKQSQALILNGQPNKALQALMAVKTQHARLRTAKTIGTSQMLNNILQSDTALIMTDIDISKKYSAAALSLDKFQSNEQNLSQVNTSILNILSSQQNWTFDIAFGQVQIKMQLAHVKQSIQNYEEMYMLLKEAEQLINNIEEMSLLKEISFQNKKKMHLQKTLIFELMAKISQFIQKQPIPIDLLESKFSETEIKLTELIQKQSHDVNLIHMRRIAIQRRRQNFKQVKQLYIDHLTKSINKLKQNAHRDEGIIKGYRLLAQIQNETKSTSSIGNAISYMQQQNIVQTHYYGLHDPRPKKTMIDIAQCHRELKNSQQSLFILKAQLQIIPFKTNPKHTIVTKTLYTMGLAYLDLGQYSLAMKCFEKGLNMLKQILTQTQFNKYHHRFKLQLQIGRVYTCLSLFPQAQERLNRYHSFVVNLYQGEHSDIANSYNYFGILHVKQKKFDLAQEQFIRSLQMFEKTSGSKSLLIAKIKCNIGLIYCYISKPNKKKALQIIDKVAALYNHIFLQNKQQNKSVIHTETYMIYYYYAQIHKRFKQYKAAKQNYEQSLISFKHLKDKIYNERSTKISSNSPSYTIKSISTQTKKQNHELYCKVRIIQCKYKLKDYSFFDQLKLVIQDLQKQIYQLNQEGIDIIDSQQKGLLIFCKKIQKYFQTHKQQFVVNQQQFQKEQKKQEDEVQQLSQQQPENNEQKINKNNIQLHFTNRMQQIRLI